MARTAEAEAPPATPQGPLERRLGILERVEVAQRTIVARTARDAPTWQTLADQEGMSIRALQRLVARYTREGARMEYPMEIIEDALHTYSEAIVELSAAAVGADCSSALVGATRLMLETVAARIELMIAVGMMPRNFAAYADQQDAVALIQSMAKVIERHNLPEYIIEELLETVDAHAAGPSPSSAID